MKQQFSQDTTAFALTGRVAVTTNRSLSGTQSFLNRNLVGKNAFLGGSPLNPLWVTQATLDMGDILNIQ